MKYHYKLDFDIDISPKEMKLFGKGIKFLIDKIVELQEPDWTDYMEEPSEEAPSSSTLEPMTPDPVYPDGGVEGPHAMMGESNPAPLTEPDENRSAMLNFDFAKMVPALEAWELFVSVVSQWAVGFNAPVDKHGDSTVLQPDRVELLKSIGEGRWPIHVLRWVANNGCLQQAVLEAMRDQAFRGNINNINEKLGEETTHFQQIDLAEQIAANMVQVSVAGFPDLAGFYDHSTKWRRTVS